MPSNPDPRFGSVTDLGEFHRQHDVSLFGCVLPILMALSVAAFIVITSGMSIFVPVILLGLVVWYLRKEARGAVAIYDLGMAVHNENLLLLGKAHLRIVRWQEIQHAEVRETRDADGAVWTDYILHTVDGHSVQLPWGLSGLDELWNTIRHHAPAWDGDRRRQPQ